MKSEIRRSQPTASESWLREQAFKKLEESRAPIATTAIAIAAPSPSQLGSSAAPVAEATPERDLWAEMRAAEEAAELAATVEAQAAAARQRWCEEFEPDLYRNPTPPASDPAPVQLRPCERQQQEPLTQQLAATLRDLLELHDFGEQVTWPSGFDARTAHQRLTAEGKR
jgi:hypothetical protein